jgi:hypothetical protein
MIIYNRETNSYSCDELSTCAHCGRTPEIYFDDNYKIECDCGMCTNWMSEEDLIKTWNARPVVKCTCPRCMGYEDPYKE